MAGNLVADVKLGATDMNGNQITAIYGGVSRLYAVYGAGNRVFIHFADDELEGANQRAALSPLTSLRSDIESRMDRLRTRDFPLLGIRRSWEDNAKSRAERKALEHERCLARYLLMALQGNIDGATAELTKLRDEMNEDRASEVRTWHILYASLSMIFIIVLSWLFSSDWYNNHVNNFGGYRPDYWNAAAIGSVGALFSIALQIRGRDIPVDLQKWDNISDAVLRIFIGSTSAVILHALFIGGVVGLQVGGTIVQIAKSGAAATAWPVVLAFTGGFTERLVSDFIGGFSLTRTTANNAAANAAAGASTMTERDIAGKPPAPVPGAAPTATTPSAHDPDKPNRIEADDMPDAAERIGGKLDPMEGQP